MEAVTAGSGLELILRALFLEVFSLFMLRSVMHVYSDLDTNLI